MTDLPEYGAVFRACELIVIRAQCLVPFAGAYTGGSFTGQDRQTIYMQFLH